PESPGQSTGSSRSHLEKKLPPSKTQLLEPPPNRAWWVASLLPTWGFSPLAGCERVMDLVLLRGDGGRLGLALHGASDGFLIGAIVEVLDLLVVLGFPVDEHADRNEQIIGLVRRDDAFGD